MLYIIGLGLELNGISLHGKKILKSADVKKVYLEEYTVEFPYTKKELEKELKIKVISANREFIESEKIVAESKKEDVVLLVYGSPLMATTHTALINSCKRQKVKFKILHSGSVFDAVAESGLSFYKFGKTASIPRWQNNYKPMSFMDIIKENQSIKAHTLLLIDIGLSFSECKAQLHESKFKYEKIIVCSKLGIKSKFFYDNLDKVPEQKIEAPYCIIVPSSLSEAEKEALELNVF